MAQMNPEKLSCSICQDLLKDPVTLSCGHSFCMSCIKSHWDEGTNSCPQCRKIFMSTPVPVNTAMAVHLVEDLRKTRVQAATADHHGAGPGDVACDHCLGRKRKATKSCLQCQVSYCEQHVQSHYEVAPLKKHKLVKASINLQEIICSRHSEEKKIFCHTDQQCICSLCSMDEHKGHNTVSAAAEMRTRQTKIRVGLRKVRQGIQDREECVKVLKKEVDAINGSAEKAIKDSEMMSAELVRLIEKKSADLKNQIMSQQEIDVRRVKELEKKLENELTELRMKAAELENLSQPKNEIMFLQNCPSLSHLTTCEDSPRINTRPLRYFQDVTAAVSEVKSNLKSSYNKEWKKISNMVIVAVKHPLQSPNTRAELSQYSFPLKLDPNTANTKLVLSEGNKKVTSVKEEQSYRYHEDRFLSKSQILSKESLTGRRYWEVEWSGLGVIVAVAYKDICRTGKESGFGNNNKSWALECFCRGNYTFKHDRKKDEIKNPITGPEPSRVGVLLDHRAGFLSFYSVSDTITLIHRVQTTFTQPLYAGLCVHFFGATAKVNVPRKQTT